MAKQRIEVPEGMVNDLINVKYAKDVKAGMRVGRWVVVKDGCITDEKGRKRIKVKCTCGSEVEKCLAMGDLKRNASLSCGCYFKENSSKIHKGKTISKEQREQHSQRMIGEGNPMYGKPCSEERKQNISESLKGKMSGEKHWNYGKHESEETKRKQSEARKGRFCGENAPSWKGGVTPISKHLGNSPVVKQWFSNSKQQANYTCELTGKVGVELRTHHLKAFSTIVKEAHELHNIQVKPQVKDYTEEELHKLEEYVASWHKDSSNAVVLSEEVHKLFHKLYGKGDNTPEQFEEFKQRYLNGEFDSKAEDVA